MLSRFRKAGDRFSKKHRSINLFDMPEPTLTREDHLFLNKTYDPIGEGAYGVVYEDVEPGVLIKEPVAESGHLMHLASILCGYSRRLEREANRKLLLLKLALLQELLH